MTTKVDGTNGVLQSYDYQVLTTAFTYTFAAGTTTLIAVPAGTLATGTITMPASPADGMVVTFSSTQQITALTVSANTGQTLVGTSTQAVPNQPISYIYRLTNTTWYPFAGGAGRASALLNGSSLTTTISPTSGATLDFLNIPSWARRITVMLGGISVNASASLILQLGTSSGVVSSGYLGSTNNFSSAPSASYPTTYFGLNNGVAGTDTTYGNVSLCNLTGNTWIESHSLGIPPAGGVCFGGGGIALAATLDRIRITTVAGTATFDAGSVNILVE